MALNIDSALMNAADSCQMTTLSKSLPDGFNLINLVQNEGERRIPNYFNINKNPKIGKSGTCNIFLG